MGRTFSGVASGLFAVSLGGFVSELLFGPLGKVGEEALQLVLFAAGGYVCALVAGPPVLKHTLWFALVLTLYLLATVVLTESSRYGYALVAFPAGFLGGWLRAKQLQQSP